MKNSQFIQMLSPSPVVFLWQCFASLVILSVGSMSVLASVLTDGQQAEVGGSFISNFFSSIVERFDQFTLAPALATFVFFAALGSVVYILVWVVSSFLLEVYRDISFAISFVHPNSYRKSRHWALAVSENAVRLAAAILAIFILVGTIFVVLPAALLIFSEGLARVDALGFIQAMLAVIMLALSMHIFVIMLRMFSFKTRLLS